MTALTPSLLKMYWIATMAIVTLVIFKVDDTVRGEWASATCRSAISNC